MQEIEREYGNSGFSSWGKIVCEEYEQAFSDCLVEKKLTHNEAVKALHEERVYINNLKECSKAREMNFLSYVKDKYSLDGDNVNDVVSFWINKTKANNSAILLNMSIPKYVYNAKSNHILNEEKILMNGEEAEEAVLNELSLYDEFDGKILNNVIIYDKSKSGTNTSESDVIILTKKGLFLFEVKSMRSTSCVEINNAGQWFKDEQKMADESTPLRQIGFHKQALQAVGVNMDIIPVIIVDGNTVIKNDFANNANIMPVTSFKQFYDSYEGNFYSEQVIDEAVKIIKENAVEEKNLPRFKHTIFNRELLDELSKRADLLFDYAMTAEGEKEYIAYRDAIREEGKKKERARKRARNRHIITALSIIIAILLGGWFCNVTIHRHQIKRVMNDPSIILDYEFKGIEGDGTGTFEVRDKYQDRFKIKKGQHNAYKLSNNDKVKINVQFVGDDFFYEREIKDGVTLTVEVSGLDSREEFIENYGKEVSYEACYRDFGLTEETNGNKFIRKGLMNGEENKLFLNYDSENGYLFIVIMKGYSMLPSLLPEEEPHYHVWAVTESGQVKEVGDISEDSMKAAVHKYYKSWGSQTIEVE